MLHRAQAPVVQVAARTVLLVDDDGCVRSALGRVLRRQVYEVLEAESGEAAMAIARAFEGRIDVLVTDVVMPGMGGRRLYQELRSLRPDTKTLFMSGYHDDPELLAMVARGEAPFLAKPFSLSELLGHVRALCGGGSGTYESPGSSR
jgi:DNA-binding NtrC family response regulator